MPSSVTFNAGDRSQTITFTATDDSIDDDDESVLLGFGASLPTGVSLGTNAQATVSINDDDSAGVSVSEASLTIDEGGSGAYTIVLDSQPTADVTITINDPSDNTDVTAEPASLTFTSTDWNSRKTVTVNAAQDANADDETATVTHTVTSTDSKYNGASANSVSVTVTDDAPAGVTVAFEQAAYRVTEGGGVSVTVSLNEDPERTVVILLVVTNHGGASDSDYSGVPESVTFNSGDTSTSFTLTAADDTLNETGESVKIAFGALPSTPIPVTAGAPDETTVTINGKSGQDMHTPPTVHFASPTYSVAEGNTVTVTVELSKAPGSDVVIPLTMTEQGEATFTDYSGVPIDVTFEAADTQRTFTFEALQDTEDDDDESVLLGFSALPDGITATTGEASQTTVTITDDDDPQVTVMFGADAYTVPEGGTQAVTVTLSADPERAVTIPIMATNQGSASSADYTVPTSVTFDTGETLKTITFTAADDSIDDDDESVLLAFGTLPTGVSEGATAATTVSITDDDVPQVTVSFGQTAYTVPEGDTVTVTITLSADPERTVAIPLTATDQGTATSADYTVPTSVTFDAGEMSKTITFTATADTEDDDDESVRLSFGAMPDPRVNPGATDETTITITDDDDPQVTVMFGADAYTVPEGGTQAVTVTLSADPERAVTIPIIATNQGSASSADYTVPTSVTFDADEMSKTITFTAADDSIDDDDESVRLSFGAMPDPRVNLGATDEATVSITDDDDPFVQVQFSQDSYTAPEGGTVSVSVTLSADPERTVVIPLVKTDQGSEEDDYSGIPSSVTFNATETVQSFTFTAAQDEVDDDDESVRLGFGMMPDAGVSPGITDETTVSITDDDDPFVQVQFSQDSYTAPEGGTVSVSVTLSADPERTVVIPLVKTDQGSEEDDYSGIPSSVTFNATETVQSFTFTAAQDEVDDDDESVRLGFGMMPDAGVSPGITDETTVSITDDDDPFVQVQFSQDSYTAPEGGTVSVSVTLSADPERTVVIPLVKTDQGSEEDDYSGIPSSVTFNATETVQSFTFTAAQDEVDDDDESVRLGFGMMPDAGVSPGTTDETTVSITDDDDPHVTVMFAQVGYRVVEGNTVAVRVTLSADPERTVVIPLAAAGQHGATSDDYSGVPENLTINAGETSKTFEFMAVADDTSDTGESVKISFGTSLPSRVTEGTPDEATVTIKQVSTQFSLDCAGTAAAWCADVGFSDQTAENWGWAYLRYGRGLDPEASLSDDDFRFRGVDYTVLSMELRPGTHPIMPNARSTTGIGSCTWMGWNSRSRTPLCLGTTSRGWGRSSSRSSTTGPHWR